jgi:phospholipid/cholesterol/gamma-HCH transport system substrate-binding protein
VVATGAVSGLNPEAQVRYRGMSVGRVSSIALDQKDPRRILVNVEVDNNIPVTKGTFAQLGMEGITGIAYVHLQDDYKDMQPKPPGPDGVVELPLKPAFLDTISDSAEGAVRDARELMASLNALLTPENRKKIDALLASLEQASARLPAAVAGAEAMLSEENRRHVASTLQHVDQTSKGLPELTRDMQLLVNEGRELVAEVNRLSAEAQGAAGTVREDTLPRVHALAESVDRASQQVGRLALQLDREPQSAIFGRRPGRPGPGEPGFQ